MFWDNIKLSNLYLKLKLLRIISKMGRVRNNLNGFSRKQIINGVGGGMCEGDCFLFYALAFLANT